MSIALFIVLASMGAATLVAVLARPLWRRGGPIGSRRLHRAQRAALKQLDRALRAGAIDAQLHATQRQQLTARLNQALAASAANELSSHPSSQWRLALGIAVAVPLIVGGLYLYVGDPGAVDRSPKASVALPSVEQMVDGLAQKLQANPNDLQGWVLLGRSYMVLNRYGDAARAYEQANRLGGNDPQVQLDYAEALVLQEPQALTDQAAPLIEAAIAGAGTNPKALWLGGLLAQAQHHDALAAQRWNALLAQPGLTDDIRRVVEQHLQALGASAAAAPNSVTAAPLTQVAAANEQGESAESSGGVEIKLSLARTLAGGLPADAPLFVFARALGQASGPPLAVKRLTVASLPANVRLTAADAMVAGNQLNAGTALQITARVMLHGGVTAEAGDLEGQVEYVGDGQPVNLQIDRVIR